MERFEKWFLDTFCPWLMKVSQFVGLIVIIYGVACLVRYFFHWNLVYIFIAICAVAFLIDDSLKDNYLERRVMRLMKDDRDKVRMIIKGDGHLIDYPILNEVTARIIEVLYREGVFDDTKDINDIKIKITKIIWKKRHHVITK
jgi:hypothetical protein